MPHKVIRSALLGTFALLASEQAIACSFAEPPPVWTQADQDRSFLERFERLPDAVELTFLTSGNSAKPAKAKITRNIKGKLNKGKRVKIYIAEGNSCVPEEPASKGTAGAGSLRRAGKKIYFEGFFTEQQKELLRQRKVF